MAEKGNVASYNWVKITAKAAQHVACRSQDNSVVRDHSAVVLPTSFNDVVFDRSLNVSLGQAYEDLRLVIADPLDLVG